MSGLQYGIWHRIRSEKATFVKIILTQTNMANKRKELPVRESAEQGPGTLSYNDNRNMLSWCRNGANCEGTNEY